MASTKRKGDRAELRIAYDLVRQGHQVAFPFGEDSDFDLILCRNDGRLERVQVKYTEHYLGEGRSQMFLRLVAPRNNQRAGIHYAADFARMEPAQLGVDVDGASGIRTHDLSDANRTL